MASYNEKQKKDIVKKICKEIETGKSLKKVLRGGDYPNLNTFYRWIDADESKRNQYARACELRADLIFEDILHIADDTSKDKKTVDLDGIETEQANNEAIQRSRLRVDARKWMLGKMMPKKYGDKLETNNVHSGEIKIVREIKK